MQDLTSDGGDCQSTVAVNLNTPSESLESLDTPLAIESLKRKLPGSDVADPVGQCFTAREVTPVGKKPRLIKNQVRKFAIDYSVLTRSSHV